MKMAGHFRDCGGAGHLPIADNNFFNNRILQAL